MINVTANRKNVKQKSNSVKGEASTIPKITKNHSFSNFVWFFYSINVLKTSLCIFWASSMKCHDRTTLKSVVLKAAIAIGDCFYKS